MPVQSSGMEGFGGFGAIQPDITQSNALPNTPFNFGVSNAGVGTGSLGQFGGYIPTPLNQFNNYKDYLSYMPGGQTMDQFANIMLSSPGIGDVGWPGNPITGNAVNNIGNDYPFGPDQTSSGRGPAGG